jgi:hypothetical protein
MRTHFRSFLRTTDRPTRQRNASRLWLEALENRCLPSSFHWVPHQDGRWLDGNNWVDQNGHTGVPTINDDASIGFTDITVTIDGNAQADHLVDLTKTVVSSGSLTAAQHLAVGAELDLKPGTTLYVPDNDTQAAVGAGSVLEGTIEVGEYTTLTLTRFTLTGTVDNLKPKDHSTVNLQGGQINPGAHLNGPGQYVQIGAGGGGSLGLNTDLSVQNLRLDVADSLYGPSKLTVTGNLDWKQGSLDNAGGTDIASGAALNVLPGGSMSTTLTNYGTANWPAGAGSIQLQGSAARFHNVGTMNVANHAQFIYGAGRFDNDGTLTAQAGPGTANCLAALNNAGLVSVPSGATLQVQNVSVVNTGTVNVDGELDFYGGATYALNSGTSVTGHGLIVVSGGNTTLQINTAVTMPNLTMTNSYVNAAGPGGLTVTCTFSMPAGFAGGSGQITLPAGATFNWTGGTIVGQITVQSGATLAISGPDGKVFSGGTLNLAGSGTWTDAGALYFNGTGDAFNITSTGTFAVQTDAPIQSAGGPINNAGLFTKDSPVGTGTTTEDPVLNNTGRVMVHSGTLQLTRGGAANNNATFDTAPGASLVFSGGGYDLNNGTQFIDAGAVQVTGATLSVLGSVIAPNFALDSGTVTGSGSLTVTGTFDWTGGTIANLTGDLAIPAGAALTIEGNGNKTLNGHTITIDGAATWKDSGSITMAGTNPTINVQSDGSFSILNDQTLSGSGFVNNYGTLTKSPGVDKTTITSGIAFANNGTVNVQSGWLEIDNFTQYTGLTNLKGSILGSTGTLAINGGELAGTGTVKANVTVDLGGIVSPGGDGVVGKLTIEGNYTQTALGVLNLDLNGTGTAGVDYDWLNITGSASLNGKLNVNFLYSPAVGDSFKPLTAAAGVTGSFAQVNNNLDPSLLLMVTNDPTDVALTVASNSGGAPESGPVATTTPSNILADAYFFQMDEKAV